MPVSQVVFVPPFTPADVITMQQLAGITPAGPPGPTPVNDFPADPTQAPTSPENSQIMLFNDTIVGEPYLKDSSGTIHTLVLAPGNTAANPLTTYMVNGFPAHGGAIGSDQPVLLLVRQGGVYVQFSGGEWQQFDVGTGSMEPAQLPAPAAPGGPPTQPALPTLPTPSSVAPGSSGNIITCGVGQPLATLSAAIPTAQAGDTIQLVAGTYTDTPPAWTVPLLIDLGGATLNATGQTANLARGKGLLVPCADSIIRNGTITGVAMDQPTGELTYAIRPDAGLGYLTISDMQIHACQGAVGEGGIGACVITLTDCDISGNGLTSNNGTALSHNLYVGADCITLTLNNVTSTGPTEGHAIKYRGPQLAVSGGSFASSPGKPFDLPNGGSVPFTITGASIVKNADDVDHGIIGYGEEGATNGTAGGSISDGSISAACPNPYMTGPGGTITMVGVTLTGNTITAQGGLTLVGS
jgi:hypothetical protein